MNVVITINCESAAFGDEPYEEVSRILSTIAERMQRECTITDHELRDINGNHVGSIWTTE